MLELVCQNGVEGGRARLYRAGIEIDHVPLVAERVTGARVFVAGGIVPGDSGDGRQEHGVAWVADEASLPRLAEGLDEARGGPLLELAGRAGRGGGGGGGRPRPR